MSPDTHALRSNSSSEPAPVVSRKALVGASGIAITMIVVFSVLAHGGSLLVTFVPGVVISWAVMVHLHHCGDVLPAPGRLLPVFMLTLGWQGLHFAEEFHTGFWRAFPDLYGGQPYSPSMFVWFNMAAYAVFGAAAVASTVKGMTALYLPALFFAVYGGIGNAVAHVTWAVMSGGYFPGLVTGAGYLVIGPALLHRMWPGGGCAGVALVALGFLVVVVPLLVLTAR